MALSLCFICPSSTIAAHQSKGGVPSSECRARELVFERGKQGEARTRVEQKAVSLESRVNTVQEEITQPCFSEQEEDLRIDEFNPEDIAALWRGDLQFSDGKRVHYHLVSLGLDQDIATINLLIRTYCNCGQLKQACLLFGKLRHRDIVSWNVVIGAHVQQGKCAQALQLLKQLHHLEDLQPDRVTYLAGLKACASLACLPEGKAIHASLINDGHESNLMIATALIDMYGKCLAVEAARCVFQKLRNRDVASWNAMIGASAQMGISTDIKLVFKQMEEEGLQPNRVTFLNILGACNSLESLVDGKEIHAQINEQLLESDLVMGNALITMYGKCGDLKNAQAMFDKMQQHNVVSWTALITEYSRQGQDEEALKLFDKMQLKGLDPDRATYATVLSACASSGALDKGMAIHVHIVFIGCESDIVLGTALVTMYGKCGATNDAYSVFTKISQGSVVSWNAMIEVYAHQGLGKEALEMFRQMLWHGTKPDRATFISVLTACACLGDLEQGQQIHKSLSHHGLESDIVAGNSLINMYGKCGALQLAQFTFDKMPEHNVISWTALISAYAHQGHAREALKLFEQMKQVGVKPNEATFLSILSACSHAGLLNEGCSYFVSMCTDYSLKPLAEHCALVIDLFGRAGKLDEAENFIHRIPLQADEFMWTALLGACRVHGDLQRVKEHAENVFHFGPQDAGPYMLVSNVYAENQLSDEAQGK